MPWVPRDVYELMLDALRQTRASVASPVVPVVTEGQAGAPSASGGPIVQSDAVGRATADRAPDIPRMVADAIAMYAFGDPVEEAANYHRAVALLKAGKSAADVVREIRQGANPETFV